MIAILLAMTVRGGGKDMNRGGSIRQMDREDYRYLIFLAMIVCVPETVTGR